MSLSRAQNIFMPANINSIVILRNLSYDSEPVSGNIENPATVSKFSISPYFAQTNPLVSYFRKHN